MKYIIDLGKEIETNIKIPQIMENKNISNFVLFSKTNDKNNFKSKK